MQEMGTATSDYCLQEPRAEMIIKAQRWHQVVKFTIHQGPREGRDACEAVIASLAGFELFCFSSLGKSGLCQEARMDFGVRLYGI